MYSYSNLYNEYCGKFVQQSNWQKPNRKFIHLNCITHICVFFLQGVVKSIKTSCCRSSSMIVSISAQFDKLSQ